MSGAPQENDNIEVVEAGAGPAQQQQAYPQRGYGGPQTRPWGGPSSWTRPQQPQWAGPMGYSAPTWARPAPQPMYQPRQAFPQYTKPWSPPQMVSRASRACINLLTLY